MRNPALFARIFNTPLMIHPAKLDAIIAGLAPRFGLPEQPAPEAFLSQTGEIKPPGYRVVGPVAVIDVFGVLAHRGGRQADSSFILGYDYIARRLDAALSDNDVRAILMNFDSPGGEVAGAFDLAAKIREAGQIKPVRAVAGDMAASAGYLLASAAESIATTDTAYLGSIGVVMRHVDLSAALANEGIKVTHIFSGAHKVDGNPYEALPAAVQSEFQSEIHALRLAFAETVGRNRGARFDTTRALATEAGIYRGAEAVAQGLADRVASPDQVLTEMQAEFSKRASARTIRSKSMSNDNNADAVYTQSDLDKARAEGREDGMKLGIEQGINAERERVTGILAHTEADGRGKQAIALVEAGLTVDQAAKVLAAAPKETAPQAEHPFLSHMAALGNPAIGPDKDLPQDDSAVIQNAWSRAFGHA